MRAKFSIKRYLMKNCFLAICMVALALTGFSQDNTETGGFKKENLFLGGNFGLSLGDYTLINLSPQLGYRFNRYLAAGMGINAIYSSNKEYFNGQPYLKTTRGIVGLNVFGRVYPLKNIMLQLQPEGNYLFGKLHFYDNNQSTSLDAEIVPSLLAGGGVVLPSGGKSAFIVSVFFDMLNNVNSPYGKRPVFNIGFNTGF